MLYFMCKRTLFVFLFFFLCVFVIGYKNLWKRVMWICLTASFSIFEKFSLCVAEINNAFSSPTQLIKSLSTLLACNVLAFSVIKSSSSIVKCWYASILLKPWLPVCHWPWCLISLVYRGDMIFILGAKYHHVRANRLREPHRAYFWMNRLVALAVSW
jgi:hypothetical protein